MLRTVSYAVMLCCTCDREEIEFVVLYCFVVSWWKLEVETYGGWLFCRYFVVIIIIMFVLSRTSAYFVSSIVSQSEIPSNRSNQPIVINDTLSPHYCRRPRGNWNDWRMCSASRAAVLQEPHPLTFPKVVLHLLPWTSLRRTKCTGWCPPIERPVWKDQLCKREQTQRNPQSSALEAPVRLRSTERRSERPTWGRRASQYFVIRSRRRFWG